MKRTAAVGLCTAIAMLCAITVWGQGNRGTSKITLKGKAVSVEYGKPSLKGGTVDKQVGRLDVGGFWRLGANKSTTFSTGVDLAFGDATVPAGDYSLWMQKDSDTSWKLVFNKQHGQWGTEHDASQDLVSTPLKQSQSSKAPDLVTITLAKKGADGGTITIEWGTMMESADFKAK